MAGLFSIFNESENNLSIIKNKESRSLTSTKLKSLGNVQCKPKGLSIRSKSDLNASCTKNYETNKFNSNDFAKPQVKKNTSNKQFTFPNKTISKSKSLANLIVRKTSSPIKLSSPIMQNVENFEFKKPEISKLKKKCDEPEKLAYYFDQYKYMNEEMEIMFEEERNLLKSARKLDCSESSIEDEGFISGSELESFEFHTEIDLLEPSLDFIELPDISDFED